VLGGPLRLRRSVASGVAGTGKTTIARLIGRYLNAFGVLPRANFVELNSLDLKGKYVGQTAPTVKKFVADAIGGTLFIDEAPALIEGGGGDHYSGEAVRTLLTEVENNRTKLMVVLAGYAEKMETLMEADDGLQRRFQRRLHLDDYTAAELAQICTKWARERYELSIDPAVERSIAAHISVEYSAEDMRKNNASLAIDLVDRAFAQLAERTMRSAVPRHSPLLSQLLCEDFGIRGQAAPSRRGPAAAPTASADEAVRIAAKVVAKAPEPLLCFLQEIPPNHLLRMLRSLTEVPRARMRSAVRGQAPPPTPPAKTSMKTIEKEKAKKRHTFEVAVEEEEEEAEEYKPMEAGEEEVAQDMLEKLKDIGVGRSPLSACSLSHAPLDSLLAGLPDVVRMVFHQWLRPALHGVRQVLLAGTRVCASTLTVAHAWEARMCRCGAALPSAAGHGSCRASDVAADRTTSVSTASTRSSRALSPRRGSGCATSLCW
jgi:SpoVK/Ycf46/Vps4 family AAA+-type ATPase